MSLRARVAALSLASALAVPAAAAPTPHPFTADDLWAMQRLSDPQLSADGKTLAYTLATPDVEANTLRTDVWLAPAAGGPARRLTAHPDKDFAPRFSSDGRTVYFLSTRSGSVQVWRIGTEGGEAEQVTRLPVDVGGLAVLPGGRLLLTVEVYPDAPTLEETAKRDQARAQAKSKAMAFDTLMFRHWDSWEDGKRSHLVVWQEGRPPIDLLKGIDADAPPRPFGGDEEITVSPDGRWAVFAMKDVGHEAAWSTNVDLWIVPTDGSRRPERLTTQPATDEQPRFSPDGKTLAWLAMARPGYESDRRRVMLMDVATRKARALTEGWDRSPDALAWSPDGKTLYVTADHLGQHPLFALDPARPVAGELSPLSPPGHVQGITPAQGAVFYLRDTLAHPAELAMLPGGAAPTGERLLTSHNAARVAQIAWGAHEQLAFKGARGDEVRGFLVWPPGRRPGDGGPKLPVALLIHGGPQGSFGNHFHYRWNPQAYAGRGYATLFIDFHGSTGYGQAFTDAIRGDWGGAPYEDLMAGLDHALARHGASLDRGRVGALGASYGGYMINWLNGKTDRFRALVCHDGNLDETMAYFDTEELWFPEWEHGGTPWENPEGYAKQSPLALVKNWKTPTLVIHGGLDYRVVDTQGMSTFTALQRRGVPSRLLYFPDENHWVVKPQNGKRWHEEVLGWLDRWVKPAKPVAAGTAAAPRAQR